MQIAEQLARRALGGDPEIFEIGDYLYVRTGGDDWYAVVDLGDGPRLQLLVNCERCDSESPERFAVRDDDERGVLVPQRTVCDHCLFAQAAVAPPLIPPTIDLTDTSTARPAEADAAQAVAQVERSAHRR